MWHTEQSIGRKTFLQWLGPALVLLIALPVKAKERIRAEAEVSAVTPPVKLTLQIYKTKLKLHKSMHQGKPMIIDGRQMYDGEPLWVKVGITNVGKHPIKVENELFEGERDFRRALENGGRFGVFFEVVGPDGKNLKMAWDQFSLRHYPDVAHPPPDEDEAAHKRRVQAKVLEWRKAGLGDEAIQDRLNQLSTEDSHAYHELYEQELLREHPPIDVQPGKTVWSPPYVDPDDEWTKARYSKPIDSFAELLNYNLKKPGVYKIRAAYDETPSFTPAQMDQLRASGWKPDEWGVRVVTPWIKISVLR